MVDRGQGATGSKRLTSDALRSDPVPSGDHCYDAKTVAGAGMLAGTCGAQYRQTLS